MVNVIQKFEVCLVGVNVYVFVITKVYCKSKTSEQHFEGVNRR
jgi:hypothetical protein